MINLQTLRMFLYFGDYYTLARLLGQGIIHVFYCRRTGFIAAVVLSIGLFSASALSMHLCVQQCHLKAFLRR